MSERAEESPPIVAFTDEDLNLLLDAKSTNLLQIVNLLFPDDSALLNLEKIALELEQERQRVQAEANSILRYQTKTEVEELQNFGENADFIQKVVEELKELMLATEEAEQRMHDMTKNIEALDIAKRNLTTSITCVKRLQMLTQAVGQLERVTSHRQYREGSTLLLAIQELSLSFEGFSEQEEILDLRNRIGKCRDELQLSILALFENSFTRNGAVSGDRLKLQEACLAMDVLEVESRERLIKWFIQLQLSEYYSTFRGNEEVAALDGTGRRYSWLKRCLARYNEEDIKLYPDSWRIPQRLCQTFCKETAEDLKQVLIKTKSLDAATLLQALTLTIDFEGFLCEQPGFDQTIFVKAISHVFEPFLDVYVESKDSTLREMIDVYRKTPLTEDLNSGIKVMSTCSDLIYFYRETVNQAEKWSTGKSFFNLYQVLAKRLQQYADQVLSWKIPKDEKRAMGDQQIREICLIINTADYCITTTEQLEERLVEKIDESFKEEVNMEKQREIFLKVINNGLNCLARAVTMACEAPLNSVQRDFNPDITPNLAVAEEAEFLGILMETCRNQAMMILSALTQSKYYRAFCDKLVEILLHDYNLTVQRTKRFSQESAEKLLLVNKQLKQGLMDLPGLGGGGTDRLPNSTYVKLLGKGLAKVDTLLRLIIMPHEPAEEFISRYLSVALSKDLAVFVRVLDMKGLKKAEQTLLISTFQRKSSED